MPPKIEQHSLHTPHKRIPPHTLGHSTHTPLDMSEGIGPMIKGDVGIIIGELITFIGVGMIMGDPIIFIVIRQSGQGPSALRSCGDFFCFSFLQFRFPPDPIKQEGKKKKQWSEKCNLLIVQYKYIKSYSGDFYSPESDPPHKIIKY